MRWWKRPWGQAVIFGPILFVMTAWVISLYLRLWSAPEDTRRDFQPIIGLSKEQVTEQKGVPLQVWKAGNPDFPSDGLGKPPIQRTFHEVWLYSGRPVAYAYVYFDAKGQCFAIDIVES